jgi:uroporphyrin-3 C-methyltransferase/uroporphyrinogen III methyltransferase/synthase
VLRRRQRAQTVVLLLVIAGLGAQWWSRIPNCATCAAKWRSACRRRQQQQRAQGRAEGRAGKHQGTASQGQRAGQQAGRAQSQQLALEQMYQDLSKNRDDWALSEIEEVLSTASSSWSWPATCRAR